MSQRWPKRAAEWFQGGPKAIPRCVILLERAPYQGGCFGRACPGKHQDDPRRHQYGSNIYLK